MAASLKSRFPEIERKMALRISAAVKEGADEVAEDARSRVPVQTGKLRDSIEVTRKGPARTAVEVGIFYGKFLEFGTKHASAQPFLVPALEGKQETIVAKVEGVLRGL